MHILVIEDEEQLCRSIAEGLRMDGYETDTCLDGDEGLELCTTENYDLILLALADWISCGSSVRQILPHQF